jgi:hypothetical protein
MTMQVLTTDQPGAWLHIVEQCPRHDFYHLPMYHALAEDLGEGKAYLFHYAEGEYSIALPLLLRSLPSEAEWQDATSVYGYPGPIASHADIPQAVVQNFQASLQKHIREMGVISVFSRLHPIIPQQALVAGMGECRTLSRTVSIDLTLPAEVQRSAFRKNHKEGINKLRRLGVTCVHDSDRLHMDAFVEVYYETMRRVGATPIYFFPRAYFRRLADGLGERLHLFVCLHEGQVICGGLFTECRGILQYHLGGTSNAALKFAPMKLLHEVTRMWANERNLQFYHLGGGATMQPDDSLLHFKLGFSRLTHEFKVWRWVVLADVYRRLCVEKSRWNEQNNLAVADAGFFPEYRAPAVHPVLQQPSLVGQGANS